MFRNIVLIGVYPGRYVGTPELTRPMNNPVEVLEQVVTDLDAVLHSDAMAVMSDAV